MSRLYEYECKYCGERFDARRSMEDRQYARCRCGERAGQVMSLVNHTFGWRLTDRCHERFGPQCEVERDV